MTHGYEWFLEYDFINLDFEDYESDVYDFEDNTLGDYEDMLDDYW